MQLYFGERDELQVRAGRARLSYRFATAAALREE